MKDDSKGDRRESSMALAARGGVGGILMGLANLVPGISGGTMLLAAGVYPNFVNAIAEVTTLKFRRESIVVLGSVVSAALVAIVLLAGVVKNFVVDHRWVAYSVFIGLTLGGVPIVWRLIKQASREVWIAAAIGFASMAAVALWQGSGDSSVGASTAGFGLLFFAGVAGASAMILPGISGGYLLLVMGVYVAILTGIDQVKVALKAGDVAALMDPLTTVVVPVGLGVVVGVVAVSNLVRWLLAHYERATLGVLLGLLVGAVVGLWPFQRGVAPVVGDVIKGRVMTQQLLASVKPKDFPIETFTPSAIEIAVALALIVGGYLATTLIARLSRTES
ncbi:MAG: DUF368 domain-containing protein [Nannocystaceae bacterium]|nr:DUF368 domain-containing protein [Nannocystaceae bacterium]